RIPIESIAHRVRTPVRVDVAGPGLIAAHVDNRHLRELSSVADEPGAVLNRERVRARARTLRMPHEVVVVPARAFVQPHELLGGDYGVAQGLHAVLDTHVVDDG